MVEMLGVLAVMGVLSVAGIAGYNSATNKHRANELLNEASKRAVVVAGQFLNRDTASLTEFTGHNSVAGATFTDTTATKDVNNQFTLTITGVSEAVCNHMQNMKTALIQKFEPSDCATTATVKLTYNVDLSVENSSDPSGGNESGTDLCADVTCPGDMTCTDGECTCPTGRFACDTANGTCCTTNQMCSTGGDTTGTCIAKGSSECMTNADCETLKGNTDYYCAISAGYTFGGSCFNNFSGTCQLKGTGTESGELKIGDDVIFEKGQFLVGGTMTWWSAKNWCAAQGRRLVKLSDLKIGKPAADLCDFPDSGNLKDDCPDGSCICESSWDASYYSEITSHLQGIIGSKSYWTDEDRNFCSAFVVGLKYGYVYNNFRANSDSALCE